MSGPLNPLKTQLGPAITLAIDWRSRNLASPNSEYNCPRFLASPAEARGPGFVRSLQKLQVDLVGNGQGLSPRIGSFAFESGPRKKSVPSGLTRSPVKHTEAGSRRRRHMGASSASSKLRIGSFPNPPRLDGKAQDRSGSGPSPTHAKRTLPTVKQSLGTPKPGGGNVSCAR